MYTSILKMEKRILEENTDQREKENSSWKMDMENHLRLTRLFDLVNTLEESDKSKKIEICNIF